MRRRTNDFFFFFFYERAKPASRLPPKLFYEPRLAASRIFLPIRTGAAKQNGRVRIFWHYFTQPR